MSNSELIGFSNKKLKRGHTKDMDKISKNDEKKTKIRMDKIYTISFLENSFATLIIKEKTSNFHTI